jgi:hypothetical protein
LRHLDHARCRRLAIPLSVSDHAGEVGRTIAFGSGDLDAAAMLSAIERSSGGCALSGELVSERIV